MNGCGGGGGGGAGEMLVMEDDEVEEEVTEDEDSASSSSREQPHLRYKLNYSPSSIEGLQLTALAHTLRCLLSLLRSLDDHQLRAQQQQQPEKQLRQWQQERRTEMDHCLGLSKGVCDSTLKWQSSTLCDGCGGTWGTRCGCLHSAHYGQAAKLPAGKEYLLEPLPSNPKVFFCPLCRSGQLLLESVERAHLGEITYMITNLRASPFFVPPLLTDVYPGLARPGGRVGGRDGVQRLSAPHVAMKSVQYEALMVLSSGFSAVPLEVFSMLYAGRGGGREEGRLANPARLLPMDPSLRHMALFWMWKTMSEEEGRERGGEGWGVWWGEWMEDEEGEEEEEEEEDEDEEGGGGGRRKRARPRRQSDRRRRALPPSPPPRDDFTCGSEPRKIPWENKVDDELPPSDYVYIRRPVPVRHVEVLWSKIPLHPCRNSEERGEEEGDGGCGCLAEDGPDASSDVVEGCMPHLNGGGRGGGDRGVARTAAYKARHGCGYLCHCAELPPLFEMGGARARDGYGKLVPPFVCRNRFEEVGPCYEVELYKTKKMGWGVKALENIPKGAPVAVYASQAHWDASSSEYSFIVAEAGGKKRSKIVLESEKFGSIARFFNHTCSDATLRPVSFMSEHSDRVNGGEGVVFVAKRNVRKGEDLSFTYRKDAFGKKCQCKACEPCENETALSSQPVDPKRKSNPPKRSY